MATLDPIPAGLTMPGRPHDRCRTMNRQSKQKGSQMNRFLPWLAASAMLLIVSSVPLRADDAAPTPADEPAHLTLAVPAIGSPEDADKVTIALKGVKGVKEVTGLTADSKRAAITYAPGQVSVQQIAQAVADVPGPASNPFRAELVVHVDNLNDSATQDKAKDAVKKVSGVADATVPDAAAGSLNVQFAPMEAADKSGAGKGATQEQILKALKDAGLTATTDITPAAKAQ